MVQRKRTPKTSSGVNGAKRHPLSEGQKVLLGKGLFQRLEPIDTRPPGKQRPWYVGLIDGKPTRRGARA